MRKFLFALTVLSVSVSAAAIAQQQRSGTAEEQTACSRDVQRFCRPVIDQGDFTILACLQQNRPKITKACDAGAEKPRPIRRPASAPNAAASACGASFWRGRNLREIADSIGFGVVFPYMGPAIIRMSRPCRRVRLNHAQMNVASS